MHTHQCTARVSIRSLLRALPVSLAIVLLAACNAPGESNSSSGSGGSMSLALPDSIQPSALPDGALSATVSASCVNNGAPRTLTDSDGDGMFTGRIENVPRGSCTFVIVFTFADAEFGDIDLVRAERTLHIGSGNNQLVLQQGDYELLDDDGDGVSNLAELDDANRTHPLTRPDWGELFWGEEKWTAGN